MHAVYKLLCYVMSSHVRNMLIYTDATSEGAVKTGGPYATLI